jgi:hypothetical protein
MNDVDPRFPAPLGMRLMAQPGRSERAPRAGGKPRAQQ